MAYKRRYLSGQEAVTVDIAEDAITSDKILPGAVGSEALARDSVTGEKITPGTIETSDLKDGLITPEKIATSAVGTEALAEKCVTPEKLSDDISPSVRPFSPGIATEEIADDAVDHDKIKSEAVESDSIKPGAVDNSAVAHDAIDDDKIADDAVQSEHIENGAVVSGKLGNNSVSEPCIIDGSCSHDKISDNAVYGDKIPDGGIDEDHLASDSVGSSELQADAVTTEKLQAAAIARRHWNSLLVRESIFFEEFGGEGLSNKWVAAGEAGGLVVPDGANGIKIQTGPLLHDTQKISFGGNGIVVPNIHKPSMMFMLTGRTDPKSWFRCWMGLVLNVSNMINFCITDAGAGATKWQAQTVSGGVVTTVDTGV